MKRINDGLTKYQRSYRKHRAERLSYKRSYDKTHKAQIAHYYRCNKGIILSHLREYRLKNRDHVNNLANIRYKRNPERQLSATRKYLSNPVNRQKKMANVVTRYCRATSVARRRGLEWNVSKSDFFELLSKRCDYCDSSVLCKYGTGLDRLDNSKGYVIGNIVPCCTACNRIRGNNLSPDEMHVAMNAVREFRLQKILKGVI